MFSKLSGRFAGDERASVAIIFAFSLLVLLAAIGLAIDYSAAYDRRSKFDTAADSAKLLRVTDVTAIKRSQQLEKNRLIERSAVDPLTDLYNKQFFQEKYCSQQCSQFGKPLSMLFIDVDNFKAINDQYGHLMDGRRREIADQMDAYLAARAVKT